jgi:hypothetical protein
MTGTISAAVLLLLMQTLLVVVVAATRPNGNIYLAVIGVSVATAPVAWLLAPWLFAATLDAVGRVYLVVLHLALGGFLFHFMTLPDRSVTLRILVELLLVPGQTMTVADLKRRYSVTTMIESRVQQLEAGSFVRVEANRDIVLLPRGLAFGRFVTAGRRLFGIGSAN